MIPIAWFIMPKAEGGLKAKAPVRNVERVRDADASLPPRIAQGVLRRWNFHEWNERQSKWATVITDQVQFGPRDNVAKTGLSFYSSCVFVLSAQRLPWRQDELEIQVVKHADFEVHGSELITLGFHVRLPNWRVPSVIGIIHFHLEMAGIYRVWAIRL